MNILHLTHKKFREGVRVKVARVETATTMWVRIESRCKLNEELTSAMNSHPRAYWPFRRHLVPGALAAVQLNFQGAALWVRAVLLQETETGFNILLIDFGIEIHRHVTMIRLLPRKFQKMAPWARKIRLLGVREQANQGTIHHAIQIAMKGRSGILMNIDSSPGEIMPARLLLNLNWIEPLKDMAEHWLNLGYVDPE